MRWRGVALPPPACAGRPPRRGGGGGRLSALTLLELTVDFLTDGGKIAHDGLVFKADDVDAEVLEALGAFGVLDQPVRGVVLRAIQFNTELALGAVKIHDEIRNRSLPQPPRRMRRQELTPQLAFRRRCLGPQRLRSRGQRLVVRQPSHPKTLQPAHPHQTPSTRGSPCAAGRGSASHATQIGDHP